jgi:hypothetical protein
VKSGSLTLGVAAKTLIAASLARRGGHGELRQLRVSPCTPQCMAWETEPTRACLPPSRSARAEAIFPARQPFVYLPGNM